MIPIASDAASNVGDRLTTPLIAERAAMRTGDADDTGLDQFLGLRPREVEPGAEKRGNGLVRVAMADDIRLKIHGAGGRDSVGRAGRSNSQYKRGYRIDEPPNRSGPIGRNRTTQDSRGFPPTEHSMRLPLAGKTIALAEGRQLEELVALLEKEGATAIRCPLVSILDAPNPEPVLEWIRELVSGNFDLVVLLTGEGLRRLIGFAERVGMKEAVVEALARVAVVTRGPKPGQALKEIGLKATRVAAAPTTEGVIATLKQEPLAGKTVGVQLYSESNPPLADYLASAGAAMRAVQPYVYAPAADADLAATLEY